MRTVILGLDGLMPELVFERFRAELVDSTDVCRETIWDRAARAGVPVIVVGVPPSYPPRRVGGCLVGCFLTPDTRRRYTFPAALADEIAAVAGDYRLDVAGFRTRPKAVVLGEIHAMTRQRFRLFRHLLGSRDWGLAVLVDMGPDRLHHAFLRHQDTRHPEHDPESSYRDVVPNYYRALDEQVGALVAALPADTAVLVLSDLGARPMRGGICLNEWLLRAGYLALKDGVTAPTPFTPEAVDWSRTRAWAVGGYSGRVHLNLRGREPLGTVSPADADALLDESDTGPDDANHDRQGAFVLVGDGIERGEVRGARLVDCHRVVAGLLGLPGATRPSTWPSEPLPSPSPRDAR